MNQYGKPFLTADWRYLAGAQSALGGRCRQALRERFAEVLRGTPSSAFLAEGPEIIIYRGRKLV